MNRDREVKVHTCRSDEICNIDYLKTTRWYYSDDPKFKSFKALPEKCECKKTVTLSRATILVLQGTALKIYKPKYKRPLNENRVDRFKIVMLVNRVQTPRVDLITKADIERAYVDGNNNYIKHIEELHNMIMEERAKLIVPFQEDPTEGRLLFPFGPDQRTVGGHK
jgi:hypothetical protein